MLRSSPSTIQHQHSGVVRNESASRVRAFDTSLLTSDREAIIASTPSTVDLASLRANSSHVLLVTTTFWENSEVSPMVVLVAVMLTSLPTAGTLEGKLKVGETPASLVLVVVVPSKVLPSPYPEGSPPPLVTKHWIVNVSLGLLLSVPVMVVVPVAESLVAEVMTGKFWPWLAWVSSASRHPCHWESDHHR
jgi:hypothetical protein